MSIRSKILVTTVFLLLGFGAGAQTLPKALFPIQLSPRTFPKYEKFFKAQAIFVFVPDAMTRFGENDELEVRIETARSIDIDVRGSRLLLTLRGLSMSWWVGGKPYYSVEMEGSIPMTVRLERGPVLALSTPDFTKLEVTKAEFAQGLSPAPASEEGLDQEMFRDFLKTLSDLMAGEGGALFRIPLPFRTGGI